MEYCFSKLCELGENESNTPAFCDSHKDLLEENQQLQTNVQSKHLSASCDKSRNALTCSNASLGEHDIFKIQDFATEDTEFEQIEFQQLELLDQQKTKKIVIKEDPTLPSLEQIIEEHGLGSSAYSLDINIDKMIPAIETDENKHLFEDLRYCYNFMLYDHLPFVKEALSVLTRLHSEDVQLHNQHIRQMIDLHQTILNMKQKCEELNIIKLRNQSSITPTTTNTTNTTTIPTTTSTTNTTTDDNVTASNAVTKADEKENFPNSNPAPRKRPADSTLPDNNPTQKRQKKEKEEKISKREKLKQTITQLTNVKRRTSLGFKITAKSSV